MATNTTPRTGLISRKPVPRTDDSTRYTPLPTAADQEASHDDTSPPREQIGDTRRENNGIAGHVGSTVHAQHVKQTKPISADNRRHYTQVREHTSSDISKHHGRDSDKQTGAKGTIQRRNLLTSALVEDWWIWEPLGLLLSAFALAGMVGLLIYYNGKQQPSWKHLSINTVVSWISTFAKAGAVLSLSSSIGQLKWIQQAEKYRSLKDLALFDSASRGELGALRLLFSVSFLQLATFGSIATVLALAFDPFNQNLVHLVSGTVEDATQLSTVSNGSQYRATGPLQGGDSYYLDPVLKANVYNSLLSPNQPAVWATPLYHCPSGNCTWAPMAVLEARALCSSVTHLLTRTCGDRIVDEGELIENCTIGLPNGPTAEYNIGNIAHPIVVRALSEDLPIQPGLVYSNHSLLRAQFLMALGSDQRQSGEAGKDINNDTRWIASECTLEPIVRSVQPSVRFATYTETTIDIWTQISWFGIAPSNVISNPNANVLYWGIQPPWGASKGMGKDQFFGLGYEAYSAIFVTLQQFFTGNVTEESDVFTFGGNQDVIESLFYGTFSQCATPSDKLRCAFENVARALSKSFRDSAFVPGAGLGRNVAGTLSNFSIDSTMARGKTLVPVTFVIVHWYWLCLPVLVWCLGLWLWVATAWKTRRSKVPRWKNSILPLLFLYREDEDEDKGKVSDYGVSNEAYVRRVEGVSARLVVGNNGARLERS